MQAKAGLPGRLLSVEGLEKSDGKARHTMGYADDIKQAVSMQDVARAYGIRVNRMGFARCPFHHEKTAPFKVYKGQGGDHCFGCGKSGDVIQFVQEYFNIGFRDALAKLNDDFHLGLPINQKRTQRQQIADAQKVYERRKVIQAKEQAVEAAKSAYWAAYDRWLIISTIVQKMRPQIADFPGDGFWAAAVMMLPAEEYKLEQAEIALYEAEKNRYN